MSTCRFKRLHTGVFAAAIVAAVGVLTFLAIGSGDGQSGQAAVIKSSEGIQALQLSDITSVTSTNPGGNSPGNLNYGISIFTGSFPTPYTECGHLNDSGIWDDRSACNGAISIGAADAIGTQTLTVTGTTTDNKSVTLNVNVPAISNVNSNMRLYVSDVGGTFHCRADKDYSTLRYPNDCDLSLENALKETYRVSTALPTTCGNNICQTGETSTSCSLDCPKPMYGYTITPSLGQDWGTLSPYAMKTGTFTLKQVDPNGTSTDQVSISLIDDAYTARQYCFATPQTFSMTGLNATQTVSVECAPLPEELGYHNMRFKVVSASNIANGWNLENSTTFSLTVKYTTPQPDGTRCLGEWTECTSGNCDTSKTPPVCAPQPGAANKANGTACTLGNECVSQYCDSASKVCAPPTPPPAPGGCGAGQVSCADSTGTSYCYTGAACPPRTPVPIPPCAANEVRCYDNGSATGYCYQGTSCPSTPAPPTPTPDPEGIISRPSNECLPGEKCESNHWCSSGSAAGSMPINGWNDSCYGKTASGKEFVQCTFQSYNNDSNYCGPMPQPKCPERLSHCRPSDTNCLDVGQKGPSTSWCWGGQECFYPDGSKTCTEWGTTCPTETTICSPTDTNCVGPGEKKTITATNAMNYWCRGDSEQCFKKDGTEIYCAQREQRNGSCDEIGYDITVCPAGYTSCNPGDKGCTSVGDAPNKTPNAWCNRGKECHTDEGLVCAKYDTECPSGSKRCRTDDQNCKEPGQEFTYGKNEWPWCPDGMSLYSLTEWKGYCEPMSMEPNAWKTFVPKPKSGYGFCRLNERYDKDKNPNGQCLEPGQTGPGTAWCGWMPPMDGPMPYMNYSSTSTRTCPKLGEKETVPVPPEPGPILPPVVCEKKLKTAAYRIVVYKTDTVCEETNNACEVNLFTTKAECEKNIGKQGKKEAQLCVQKYAQLKEKAEKLMADNPDISFRDGQLLAGIAEKMGIVSGDFKKLSETEKWAQLAQDCGSELAQRERELDPVFKRLGSVQVGALILKRIQDFRGNLEEAQSKLIFFKVEDSKALEMIDKMLAKLEVAEECHADKDYECSKNILKKLEDAKERLIVKLAEYNVEFTQTTLTNVTKFIKEDVAKLFEQKLQKFESVMTELIEKKLETLAINIAKLEEKLSEAVINATTTAIENATYIAEEAVKDKFLRRMDELTASIIALEEKLGQGTVARKVREVNELILGNAWSEGFAAELQESLAGVLAAQSAGESSAELIAKLNLIIERAETHMEEEHRALVDEGIIGFEDAPVGRWDGGLMLAAKNSCIAKGRGDNPYKLDATRNTLYQETVALTIRTAGIPLTATSLHEPITGLASDSWAVPYWATLQETGYDTGIFAYNADTTRGQAAKLMYSLMKDKLPTQTNETEAASKVSSFKDYESFKKDAEMVSAIAAMVSNGLMQGYGEQSPRAGHFGYEDPMTRNMLIAVMVRAAELMEIDPCAVQ